MIACNLLFVINISSFHCCNLEVITSRCKIGCHWLFRLQRLKKILFLHNGECELFFKLFASLRGRHLKGKGNSLSLPFQTPATQASYLLAINKENFRKQRPCVSSSFIIFAVGCTNLTFKGNMRQ